MTDQVGRRAFVGAASGMLVVATLGGCAAARPSGAATASPRVDSVSSAGGSVSGGSTVVFSGAGLDAVGRVEFGGVIAPITRSTANELAVTVPAQAAFTASTETVVLLARADEPLAVTGAGASALVYEYRVESDVDRQLEYAMAHFADTSSDRYGYLGSTDCVNFTSQTLVARGWQQDDGWWCTNDDGANDDGGIDDGAIDDGAIDDGAIDDGAIEYAAAWISSTAFMRYLGEHPERATAVGDDERERLKPGDIVQFDWDRSGDRDHTGVITRIEPQGDGSIALRYACHSGAADYRSVDEEVTSRHPGGAVYFWSVSEGS